MSLAARALGPTTWLAAWPRWRARLVLAAIAIAAIAGVIVSRPAARQLAALPSTGADVAFYAHVVERVRAGEGYYAATAAELEAGGYPRWSSFHYRLPTYAWLFARLPLAVVRLGALALALGVALAWYARLRRRVEWPLALAALVLLAGLWQAVGELYFMTELWAGLLIMLALAAQARGRPGVGFVAAAAALGLRELALPFVLVCAATARRRRARLAWIGLVVAFALALGLHARAVPAAGLAVQQGTRGWLHGGGLAFLISCCRVDALLFALPAWVSALYLPLAVAGALADGRHPRAISADEIAEAAKATEADEALADRRLGLALAAYVVAFAGIGMVNRFYWGLVWQPLAIVACARGPAALRDLARAAGGKKNASSMVGSPAGRVFPDREEIP